jgi:AAA+ superfamily predicted ATPase
MTAPAAGGDGPSRHLSLQLGRLDVLLHREILRLRAMDQLSADDLRGLYISDAQVDALVNRTGAEVDGRAEVAELTAQADRLGQANLERASDDLPWCRLARRFDLSAAEQDVLLVAVALDVDPKYETLYAYLNDHITRRWPTIGLALSVVAPTRAAQPSFRQLLLPDGRLFKSGLLRLLPAPADRASWLATGFRAAATVTRFLLGEPLGAPEGTALVGDAPPEEGDSLPGALRAELARAGAGLDARRTPPVVVLQGHSGAGRTEAARVLAAAARSTLLRIDARAPPGRDAWAPLAEELALYARLTPTVLFIAHADGLFDGEGRLAADARPLVGAVGSFPGPVCVSVEPSSPWRDLVAARPHVVVPVPDPGVEERARQWREALRGAAVEAPASAVGAVADRFALTPRQIRAAADALAWRPGAPAALDEGALFTAARAQCTHRMGDLATGVETAHGWEDLVLPSTTLRRLREIVGAVAHRRLVYGGWGFGRGGGQGFKILFAGPSGTGKTMSAGVMARALGLDLYRIDLSAVVSKFIGETEKNLARIFRAAASSNAVLFFDEADALFGKRSEVKDAHDRYANIEVAYLLQRIEDYDGLVILATNLGRNIDQAFSRRLHEVVEFPMPDELQRERLWRGMLGPQVPVAADVDPRFLSKQFPLAGGDIRNVALEAAFLAAQDGRVITMEKLVRAMARQMMKQGRIPSATDFKQYHSLLGEPGAP